MPISRREFLLDAGLAAPLGWAAGVGIEGAKAPLLPEAHRFAYPKTVRLHSPEGEGETVSSGVIISADPIQILTAGPCRRERATVKVFHGIIYDNQGRGQKETIPFAPNLMFKVTSQPACQGRLQVLTVDDTWLGVPPLAQFQAVSGERIDALSIAQPVLPLGVDRILVMGFGPIYPLHRYLTAIFSRRPAAIEGLDLPPSMKGAGVFDATDLGLVAVVTSVHPGGVELAYAK